MDRCTYCKPHASPKRQRLCHEGQRLWEAMRDAGMKYISLCGMREPPVVAVENAKEARQKAREAFNAHTGRQS